MSDKKLRLVVDEKPDNHDQEFAFGIINTQSGTVPMDLEGLVCTKCGDVITSRDLAFTMNFGKESSKHPLATTQRFTGLAWHAGSADKSKKRPVCLNIRQLPGCENRDEIDEEFSKAITPCTLGPRSRMDH